MKIVTIEKRKKFEHIIGSESKQEFLYDSEENIPYPVADVLSRLDYETYTSHEDEINDILSLVDGEYHIDSGDFDYFIKIKEGVYN